jgi:transcription elongation GreA/GreB family factor
MRNDQRALCTRREDALRHADKAARTIEIRGETHSPQQAAIVIVETSPKCNISMVNFGEKITVLHRHNLTVMCPLTLVARRDIKNNL